MKLDFDDILIVPAMTTEINSRSEVDVNCLHFGFNHLPIIASPMDTVVDENNIAEFERLNISYCIPRGCPVKPTDDNIDIMAFKSYSLDEFINKFCGHGINPEDLSKYILIDVANGHMDKLLEAVITFKRKFDSTYKLMVGNVANPQTFKLLSIAGADYIRIGIGNGNGCLTTQQTGIGYPMASLIIECSSIANEIELPKRAKIVADGGMKSYSDIIKALALGADYVMIGSLLNKALDSSGPVTLFGIDIDQHADYAKWLLDLGLPLRKKFRGMSTKDVQKKLKNNNLKTSEGVSRIYKIDYTLESWTINFIDYLKSAMSYTDKKSLVTFIGNVDIIEISNSAFRRFNK